MTFIDPLDPQQAPDEIRVVLERTSDLRVLGVMAQAQRTFTPWLGFATALLSELELSPMLRELAILQVALLDPGGDYEWSQHAPLALAAGASQAQLQALHRGAASTPEFTGEQLLVLRFTRQVVREGRATGRTRAALVDTLGPGQVVELLQVIGHYMMVARVVATAGLEPEAMAAVVAQEARVVPLAGNDGAEAEVTR
jgi:4-carboxymuconolactone decarboxylase